MIVLKIVDTTGAVKTHRMDMAFAPFIYETVCTDIFSERQLGLSLRELDALSNNCTGDSSLSRVGANRCATMRKMTSSSVSSCLVGSEFSAVVPCDSSASWEPPYEEREVATPPLCRRRLAFDTFLGGWITVPVK